MEIGVVVIVVLEDCHHLVVPDNGFSYSFDAAIFVDDDACSSADSEGISHFGGVCAPIAHVVEFSSQDLLDSFDCMACHFAGSRKWNGQLQLYRKWSCFEKPLVAGQ